ncbi:MAG: leucyl aminopeptidase [Nitrososphaerales archaeon]
MLIKVEVLKPEEKVTPLLALGIFENQKVVSLNHEGVNERLGGILNDILQGEFQGKLETTYLVRTNFKTSPTRILLVGLGPQEEFTLTEVRRGAGKAAQITKDLGLKSFSISFISGNGLNKSEVSRSIVEGLELALYSYDRHKTAETSEIVVGETTLILHSDNDLKAVEQGARLGEISAKATALARDLANSPGNFCTPSKLAEAAREMADRSSIKATILGREEMAKMGMGGVLGVSQGSAEPPKFIILEYAGGSTDSPAFFLVGKAVTFDTGGISIKPSDKMEEMKYDMSGGAAVIGAMQALAEIGLPINVTGLVPATENMPSDSAYKPGDVIQIHDGKTIEIINTDAEGRLLLADALAYARSKKPEAIIDLATLTGACVIALGNHATGMVTNNAELGSKVRLAGDSAGEKVWELPLWKEYSEQIKSQVADMKNTGGRAGGAITAAALLSKFVEDTPWVHLDIAGTAWTQESSAEISYIRKGATGIGVRLLIEFFRKWNS